MVELFRVHQQLGNKDHNIVFNTRICKGNGESMSIGLYHSGHCVIGMKGNMATINCVEITKQQVPGTTLENPQMHCLWSKMNMHVKANKYWFTRFVLSSSRQPRLLV